MHLSTLEKALECIAAYAILVVAQYGKDNYLWKEHMRSIFNFKNRPYWKLEEFYIPHTYELKPINYPFK